MSLTAYPTLRLKLTMPQALKLQFLPAIPGSNAAAAAAVAVLAAQQAQDAANTAVAATANKVDRTGDVMTGFLTLNADPTGLLHAATKQYVDAQSGSGGIPEAPSDGTTYGRRNAAWTAVPTGVTDGDKTDITVSGGGLTWTIDNDVVTYAKMQNVTATARFVGRITAGAGDPEELTGTQATTLLDPFTSALKGVAPASGGGTTNFLRADGTWATPASGGAPTNAEYVVAATDATLTNERVLTNTATVIWDFTTPGQVKATATGGGGGSLPPDGTYTDIAVTSSGTIWTIRPAVVTYSKIQNISATNRLLGRITAGAGSTEELTGANVKTIVGSGDLTKADDTNVTLTLGGTPAAALYNAVSLTLGWTGTLSVARGGLGVGTITGLMQGNGTGAVTGITNSSTVGQVLRVTGASTYAWGALDLASANATTGDLPFSALAQGSARSVLGVTGNATADVASIQGATDQVLRVNGAGNALAFGAIDLSKTAAATGVLQAASHPALTGDVTTASGAVATTIANDAVTYVKMQNVSAASLLIGRGSAAGAGDPQEITLGTNLSMSGTTLNASGGGGSGFTAPQGRLTLQTATPVMTTTQSAKTTIFYSAYVGDQVPISNGATWTMTAITGGEISVLTNDTTKSPAAIGANKVNDWFIWSDAGTLRIGHGPDWTNDTTRSAGTALVMINGIWLNSAAITNGPAASCGTYVGTTRSNASSQLSWIYGAVSANGTAGFFGVWNAYNRVSIASLCGDNTDSWSYAVAGTIRAANGSSTMRHSFVCGLAEDAFEAVYSLAGTQTSTVAASIIGVCYDVTNAFSGQQGWNYGAVLSTVTGCHSTTALGFHFFQAGEATDNDATFYGDNTFPLRNQSGMTFRGRM